MSFEAELEALIATANSSLNEFEAVLRRAQLGSHHGDGADDGDGCVGEIQAQFDRIHQKILSSLLKFRESYNHDQERISELERDLKLDFENVRQCAVDYFIKGDYLQCERLLSFLTKVLPDDGDLEHFLELSRKHVENRMEKTRSAIEGKPHPKGGGRDESLSQRNHDQETDQTPNTPGEDLEPTPPRAKETTYL